MLLKQWKHWFLFEELVKRDFKKKYKRSVLGMFWSLLSPLATMCVLAIVFTNLLGRNQPHYIIYLFIGQVFFSFFTEATNGGMCSLYGSSAIYSKINVPKYLFIMTGNFAAIINFLMSLIILFVFVLFDGLLISFKPLIMVFPIALLVIFNLGVSTVLSIFYVLFKDTQYLYSIVTRLLMYASAIFYTTDSFSKTGKFLFHLNPVYCFISYARTVLIYNEIPSMFLHLFCILHCCWSIILAIIVYERYKEKLLYFT